MDAAHIAEILRPFLGPPAAQRLTPEALQDISTYIDILLRWNARMNLTAIRDPEEIVLRHFGESLFAAQHLLPGESHVGTAAPDRGEAITTRVADVGSGAGFPGIPFKLWAPKISLTLIESVQKKATFLREVIRSLALTNVKIVNARAESLTETFDLVTLRAVEDFASILPIAAALVARGGRLGLLIGSAQIEPARASLPQFSWSEAVSIPHSRSRVVLAGCRPR